MIYAVLAKDDVKTDFCFDCWECFHRATFNPFIKQICVIELGRLKGKTYKERKECLRNKAVEYSNNQYGGLSYFELSCIQEYFSRYAKRYGLLSEFHENGIC